MIDLGHDLVLPAATEVVSYPSRAAWLAARLLGLGASDVPKVLGVSPYGGHWDVVAPRLNVAVERADTPQMARGRRWESRIIEDYAEASGSTLWQLGTVHVVGPHPLRVTPDAFEHDPVLGWGGCEVKTDRTSFPWGPSGLFVDAWGPRWAGLIREDYAAQCYACMMATGLPWWRLVVMRSLDDLRWYTLAADLDLQATVLRLLEEWWVHHIVSRQLPAWDDSAACRAAVRRLFPPRGLKRSATEQEVYQAHAIEQFRAVEKQALANRRTMEAGLGAGMGATGTRTITWPQGRATWHPEGGGRDLTITLRKS